MVEWKKLGEVCEIKGRIGFRGYTRDDQVKKGEGAISLSPGNIIDGIIDYTSCTFITWEKYEESPEIMVNEGDIILCKTASVGKVSRIHYLPEKATINPQLVLIKNIKTNPQYLFYVLDDSHFQNKIKGLAGVGSVPNVSQAKLSSIDIPIPSLSEQNRIVGILDTFTAGIENIKEQIAQRRKQYEFYRDQLLDLEGKEGVEIMTIKDVAKIMNGKDYKKLNEGNIPVYGTGGIMTFVDQYAYNKPSVLLPRKGSIEKIYFVEEPFWTVDTIYWTKIDDSLVIPKYLYVALSIVNLKELSYGGGIPSLSQEILYKVKLPVPSLQEQQRIVSILDTFEASISNLEAQLKQREKQYEYYRNKLLTFE